MFAFLKKLIAGKQVDTKFNAVESKMDIDGEQVSVKELIDTYKAEQVEMEEKKKLEAAQFEEVSMDNEVADSEGNKYKIGDLIESHRNRTVAKKNASEDEEKAEKEKENASKCNCDAKDGKHNAECPAKEKEGKENEAEESDEELKIKKQNAEADEKKKEEEEKKAKENAKGGDKLRFFKKLNTLRDEAEGKREVAVKSIGTMSDRLARGKAKFGAKKQAAKK